MSDYAELVERLHDEARLPAQKDWDRHEAADAIKALVQERDRLLRDLEIMVRRADNEERAMERAERAEAKLAARNGVIKGTLGPKEIKP